jgi:hypothetical protein
MEGLEVAHPAARRARRDGVNGPLPEPDDRDRCSDAARERGDPLFATAPPAGRLLLVEVPGPWGAAGLTATRLPAEVTGPLADTLEAAGVRVQLLRRPGRHPVRGVPSPPPEGYRWALADAGPGVVRWGRWHAADDLLAIDPGEPLDPLVHGATGPQRLVLVCAHAKRDVCCAVRGRPVAAAAAAAIDREVWETSHLGGDRFAANLLLLPEGEVFGGLDVDSAVEVAHRLDSGHLTLGCHRGRIGRSPAAQAALHLAAVELHDDRLGAVRLAGPPEQDGAQCFAVVEHAGRRYVVRFEEWWTEPGYLSCSALAAKPARRFTLRSFGEHPGVRRAG